MEFGLLLFIGRSRWARYGWPWGSRTSWGTSSRRPGVWGSIWRTVWSTWVRLPLHCLKMYNFLRSILLIWTTLTFRDPSRQRIWVLVIVYRYNYNYSQQQGGQYGNGPQGGWGGYNQQQGYPQQQSGDPSQGGKYELVYHTIIYRSNRQKLQIIVRHLKSLIN